MRIAVIGTTGCGKTTTAGRIARRLGVPHIELDALFWLPEWKQRDDPDFREQAIAALAGDSWVSDGNYTRQIGDLTLDRADLIVWVDTNFWIAFPRLLQRSIWRAWSQEPLWGINRERWRLIFFSRRSLLIWYVQSFGRHRRKYLAMSGEPKYAGRVIRVQSDHEIDGFLESLPG